MQFTELTPRHADLVHDIAFDYYGKRFASCSSDKQIKVQYISILNEDIMNLWKI